MLQDAQHTCQGGFVAELQAPCFLTVYLFHFVIIYETVFSCYLSLGRNPSPHSFWKKVQCCFLISSAAFHLFQVLMAFPIMQCSRQMLGYLPGPLPTQRVQKMVIFFVSIPATGHLVRLEPVTSPLSAGSASQLSHLSRMPSHTQAPRLANHRLFFQSFLFYSLYPSHYELLCFLLTNVD